MNNDTTSVCPVEKAGLLESRIRRWLQNPRKIVTPYIEEGMIVLDIGCGPGFFSVAMAHLVGKTGRVIACDLQEGMLQKLKDKIQGTELEQRVTLHKCEENKLGVSEKVDFILAFYMVHEIPDKKEFFREIGSLLKPKGKFLMVEPPFHVSKTEFLKTLSTAREAGLSLVARPKVFLSKTAVLELADIKSDK
jgi:ubiquinone/menaquinone biosynthesis C-methylase UbiE